MACCRTLTYRPAPTRVAAELWPPELYQRVGTNASWAAEADDGSQGSKAATVLVLVLVLAVKIRSTTALKCKTVSLHSDVKRVRP